VSPRHEDTTALAAPPAERRRSRAGEAGLPRGVGDTEALWREMCGTMPSGRPAFSRPGPVMRLKSVGPSQAISFFPREFEQASEALDVIK